MDFGESKSRFDLIGFEKCETSRDHLYIFIITYIFKVAPGDTGFVSDLRWIYRGALQIEIDLVK